MGVVVGTDTCRTLLVGDGEMARSTVLETRSAILVVVVAAAVVLIIAVAEASVVNCPATQSIRV